MTHLAKPLGIVFGAAFAVSAVMPAYAASHSGSCEKPGGFPERPLTMIVPYGPGGGSGQVARGMIQGVKDFSGDDINADYKPGGAGIVGLKTYMAAPQDGYTVLEHIDDASSAFAAGRSEVHPANDLIPLVVSQITFSQIYIRKSEDPFHRLELGYVELRARAQGGKSHDRQRVRAKAQWSGSKHEPDRRSLRHKASADQLRQGRTTLRLLSRAARSTRCSSSRAT